MTYWIGSAPSGRGDKIPGDKMGVIFLDLNSWLDLESSANLLMREEMFYHEVLSFSLGKSTKIWGSYPGLKGLFTSSFPTEDSPECNIEIYGSYPVVNLCSNLSLGFLIIHAGIFLPSGPSSIVWPIAWPISGSDCLSNSMSYLACKVSGSISNFLILSTGGKYFFS